MTDQELQEQGRVVGVNFIKTAIVSSKDSEELTNKIYVCRCAALHILATEIYNDVHQNGATDNERIVEFMKDIQNELMFLRARQLDTAVAGEILS